MSAVLPSVSVTLTLNARILVDLMFVLAKLDLLEMGKLAQVRKCKKNTVLAKDGILVRFELPSFLPIQAFLAATH